MGLPKPPEENIELTVEDIHKTEDMKKLTAVIKQTINSQENQINKFYKHFSELEGWINANQGELDKFRSRMIEDISFLREHVSNTLTLLNNIKLMTENQERLDSKKIMLKLSVSQDYMQEEIFGKHLKFPRDIRKLAHQISKEIEDTKEKTSVDLEVEKKTEELVGNMIGMLNRIQDRLEKFVYIFEESEGVLMSQFRELKEYIQKERAAFEKLNRFEMVHLDLLLKIYQEEEKEEHEEQAFAEEEKGLNT